MKYASIDPESTNSQIIDSNQIETLSQELADTRLNNSNKEYKWRNFLQIDNYDLDRDMAKSIYNNKIFLGINKSVSSPQKRVTEPNNRTR